MTMENKIMDTEIYKSDNIIITKILGPWMYAGILPALPTREKDKDLNDKMA
jgi:hypothetical protein